MRTNLLTEICPTLQYAKNPFSLVISGFFLVDLLFPKPNSGLD